MFDERPCIKGGGLNKEYIWPLPSVSCVHILGTHRKEHSYMETHKHIHTQKYIYIYIFMYISMCKGT